MKKILVVLLALVLTGSMAFGQEVNPNITAGSKALLFSFNGLAFLAAGNFDGGIGGKFFLSDMMAVRVGLQFASASATNPWPGVVTPPNTSVDGTQSATQFGVGGAVELHLAKGRVRPFIGGGVGFSTTSTESKDPERGNPPPAQTTVKNNANGETIGGMTFVAGSSIEVYGLVGFEYFLYNEISLGAEYRVGFMSLSQKDQEISSGSVTVTTKGGSSSLIGVTTSGVFTLAVYL
ncbi:MAG: outer membrane beta-barrel protein [Bacteroidota bacterium]